MGQFPCGLFPPGADGARLGTLLRNIFRRAAEVPSNPVLLHQLPVEIILLISEELRGDPESAIMLALTCKTFKSLLLPKALREGEVSRLALVNILERDVGDKYYACQWCSTLHPFSPTWTVTPYTWKSISSWKSYSGGIQCKSPRRRARRFELKGGVGFEMDYHIPRLVMNRHFYGPSHGLPLDALSFSIMKRPFKADWLQHWKARIIDGELYLRVEYRFRNTWAAHMGMWDVSRETGPLAGEMCSHCWAACWELHKLGPNNLRHDPYHNAKSFGTSVESCRFCLADFHTTIGPITGLVSSLRTKKLSALQRHQLLDSRIGWYIYVHAYYQFGSGRSPTDWKWQAMVGIDTKGSRDFDSHPVGAVMKRWQAAERKGLRGEYTLL